MHADVIRLHAYDLLLIFAICLYLASKRAEQMEMIMEQLLNTKQAANYLSVSAAFLERDRWAGARIQFVKLGSRSIRYRQQDLDNYIEQQLRSSTSEDAA